LGNKNLNTENIERNDDIELNKTLSTVNLNQFLATFVNHLRHDHNLTSEQITALFGKRLLSRNLLPISIFDNKELSCLETIVKHLKEKFKLRFHEIALLLNRDDRTIWSTYSNACKKRKEKLRVKESKFFIPISIFTARKLSVLESLVSYLKDNFNLRYREIAILLRRDERNIWTVYHRAKKK